MAAILSVLALVSGCGGPDPAPASLTADLDPSQAARAPIVMLLTLKAPAVAPLQFWCGGPGAYPRADAFSVLIVDSGGRAWTATLSNGQCVEGSGQVRTVPTGTSIALPAVLDPLPAGAYSLRFFGEAGPEWPAFSTSTAIAITVRDDADLATEREREILERVRAGEPFASHVARKYRGAAVVAGLLEDLEKDDAARAARAADTLARLDPIPATATARAMHAGDALAVIEPLPATFSAPAARAIRKHLAARADAPLYSLLIIAARAGTDEDLDAILALCASDLDSDLRWRAVETLRLFAQARAREALAGYLTDHEPIVAFGAARSLAESGDRRALAALLAMLADSRWPATNTTFPARDDIFQPLIEHFSGDAGARDAIRLATTDADPRVREAAIHAAGNPR